MIRLSMTEEHPTDSYGQMGLFPAPKISVGDIVWFYGKPEDSLAPQYGVVKLYNEKVSTCLVNGEINKIWIKANKLSLAMVDKTDKDFNIEDVVVWDGIAPEYVGSEVMKSFAGSVPIVDRVSKIILPSLTHKGVWIKLYSGFLVFPQNLAKVTGHD
jgi:hypothetical protein